MKHKIAKYLHRLAAYLEKDIPGARMNSTQNQEVIKKAYSKERIEVKNTYEAAFYMSIGGIYEGIRKRKVPENKWDKYGYREKWYITISNVPSGAIDRYRNGTAQGNVVDMQRERMRVKNYAKII